MYMYVCLFVGQVIVQIWYINIVHTLHRSSGSVVGLCD